MSSRKQLEAIEDRITQLRAKARKLKAVENQKKQEKLDRTKYLTGAWFLKQLEQEKYPKEQFDEEIGAFLTKKKDRELFGLS